MNEHTVRLTHDLIVDGWRRARDWWQKEGQLVQTRSDVLVLMHAGAHLPSHMLDRAELMVTDWRDEPDTGPQSDVSQFVQRHMREAFDPHHPARADGEPRLNDAAKLGNHDLVIHMLAAGADPNLASSRDGIKGLTALIAAAVYGHVDIMRTLLDRGARLDATSETGHTPLDYAIG